MRVMLPKVKRRLEEEDFVQNNVRPCARRLSLQAPPGLMLGRYVNSVPMMCRTTRRQTAVSSE